MNWDRRLASSVLGSAGIAFASLMIYVFAAEYLSDRGKVDPGAIEAVDVAVFFPDRVDWRIFRRAATECLTVRRRLGRVVVEDDSTIVIETARLRRRVRFTRIDVRGEWETLQAARRLKSSRRPPIAVVGSSNTVLTNALARGLAEAFPHEAEGPLLLVPWATSRSLLRFYPGRMFRFASNNLRAAEMLIGCVGEKSGGKAPARIVMLVDRIDPYSVDLAACFRDVAATRFPSAKLQQRFDILDRVTTKTSENGEQEFARVLWSGVAAAPSDSIWLLLPVQNEPARRLLAALNAAAPAGSRSGRRGLTVICGDAVGTTTLESFAGLLNYPVWGLSTVSNLGLPDTAGLGDDVQLLGEIGVALLTGLDEPGEPTPALLRQELLSLHVRTSDAYSFGRPIAFLPSGERAWETADDVLHLAPGRSPVSFCTRDALGVWSDPRPLVIGSAGRKAP